MRPAIPSCFTISKCDVVAELSVAIWKQAGEDGWWWSMGEFRTWQSDSLITSRTRSCEPFEMFYLSFWVCQTSAYNCRLLYGQALLRILITGPGSQLPSSWHTSEPKPWQSDHWSPWKPWQHATIHFTPWQLERWSPWNLDNRSTLATYNQSTSFELLQPDCG